MHAGPAELIDAHTRGVLPGELVALAAYTKIGKTFLMCQRRHSTARTGGYTPLIMTLEQSIEEIEDRIDALFSGVSYERLQAGALTIDESATLMAAREELKELGPLHVETPQRGERTVKNIVTRCRQLGADYLLIDQLSHMDGDQDYRGDRALTAKAWRPDLRTQGRRGTEVSRRDSVCSRSATQPRDDADLGTADRRWPGWAAELRHSSMIEQTVDLALGLWRSKEARANNSMMIDIMGARRCDLKSWVLSWHLSERTEISVRNELIEMRTRLRAYRFGAHLPELHAPVGRPGHPGPLRSRESAHRDQQGRHHRDHA